MSYCDYGDFYEPSEFDGKIEELKDFLRDSVKREWSDERDDAKRLYTAIKEENKKLKEENSLLKREMSDKTCESEIANIVVKNITKDNIENIINSLYAKTFNEATGRCSLWWGLYVNYYNDRNEVVKLMDYAGLDVPKEILNITLPHEWDYTLLDNFFATINNHYVCNGNIYSNNLEYWSYHSALHVFSSNSGYSEIPWQFVLRNPLLNSTKYALEISKAINNGGNGKYFCKICDYQKLDNDVLKTIVNNCDLNYEFNETNVNSFLIEHIELLNDEQKLNDIFNIICQRWKPDSSILKMPKEYWIKYANMLEDIDKVSQFLLRTSLTSEEKTAILVAKL